MDLRIRDGVVEDVKFKGRGCAISQASASLLTESIKGKRVAEIDAIGKEDVLENLGISISAARLKCALLGLKVLKQALALKYADD
jgi:nitrogen fixation NifU-like protein